MSTKKIHWIFGPTEYRYASTMKYSTDYVSELDTTKTSIHQIWCKYRSRSMARYIWQFVIVPLKIMTIYRRDTIVLPDEGYLVFAHIPFFPIHNCICIVHDYRNPLDTNKNPSLLKKWYYQCTSKGFIHLNKAKVVISVSDFTSKTLKDIGIDNKNQYTIYNGFSDIFSHTKTPEDRVKYLKNTHEIDIPEENKILLYVGSEEDRKNILTLLKSMKCYEGISLIKVGRAVVDNNRQIHREYVEKNKLDVHFIDRVTDQELAKIYRIADVFIMPSLFEGFGRPPIEAQMSGCPVISTHSGGLKEVLQDSCLLLQNPEDTNELRTHISTLLRDECTQQEYIRRGYENSARFTLHAGVKKWTKILSESIGK